MGNKFLHQTEALDSTREKSLNKSKKVWNNPGIRSILKLQKQNALSVSLRPPNLACPLAHPRFLGRISMGKIRPGFLALGGEMKGSKTTSGTFGKTSACPSSNILLSFRLEKLAPELLTLVKYHLKICEFCSAELPLLAHHCPQKRGETRPPEIPMNLRILAESILCQNSKTRNIS